MPAPIGLNLIPAPLGPADAPSPLWNWVRVRALVIDSVASPHSRRAYGKALDEFFAWTREFGQGGFTRETVQRYRTHIEARGLAPSSANIQLTAVKKLAREAAANGLIPFELAHSIGGIKGSRQKGRRLGAWLTLDQTHELLRAPVGDSLRSRRDRALLAVLIGCGLRRAELATLTVAHVQQREGRWVLVDIAGKGSRIRSVPMPSWAKAAIDVWLEASAIAEGRLFRSLPQKREIGGGLTAQAVYLIVKGYAAQLGITAAPHDLRRTFAKLAHRGRSPLEQIQLSLGHDSILTTERYLGVRQSLSDAPCDHLGIHLKTF